MSVIVPFNLIEGSPSTGGTWSTSETTGAAPLPPAAPGAFGGTLNFTGVAAGSYVYTYTVTNGTCVTSSDVTIAVGKATPVRNDNCNSGRNVVFPYTGGTSILYGQSLAKECPGIDAPTLSVVAIPTAWTGLDIQRDLWFVVMFDSTYPPNPIIAASFTVDGNAYGDEGIVEPLLAVYHNCSGTLIDVEVPQGNAKEVNLTLTNLFNISRNFYVRVSCKEGNEGRFDLTVAV